MRQTRGSRLVKRLWTDSIRLMSFSW